MAKRAAGAALHAQKNNNEAQFLTRIRQDHNTKGLQEVLTFHAARSRSGTRT
jgi:hypothetical protein